MKFMVLTTLAVMLLLAGSALANFGADCQDGNTNWEKHYEAIKNFVWAPTSGCQNSAMGLTPDSSGAKNKIGGQGSVTIMGVPAGSGSGGCTDAYSCNKICQALCCLAKDCKYAVVGRDKSGANYGVYDDTSYTYYCNTFKSGSWTSSDSSAGCTANNKVNCATITKNGLGMDDETYSYLMSVQDPAKYATCPPTSGRRLLSETDVTKPTNLISAKKIDEVVNQTKLRWSDIKKALGTNKRAIKKKAKAHCAANFLN